jgi:hypothetical protein
MATGVRRNCYVRRKGGETRVEDRGDPNEVSLEDLAAVAAALKQWERTQARSVPAKSTKAKEPPNWHRQHQAKVKLPLWILLAKAAVSEGIASGKIRRGGGSTDGWESQVLDGESPYPRPGLA